VKRYLAAGVMAAGVAVTWPGLAEMHRPWALILLVLMALDFALALAEAAAPGGPGIKVAELWATARKALAYYASILAVYLMGAYRPEAWEAVPGLYLFWSGVEALSVLGHAASLGAPVPEWVRALFESVRKEG